MLGLVGVVSRVLSAGLEDVTRSLLVVVVATVSLSFRSVTVISGFSVFFASVASFLASVVLTGGFVVVPVVVGRGVRTLAVVDVFSFTTT